MNWFVSYTQAVLQVALQRVEAGFRGDSYIYMYIHITNMIHSSSSTSSSVYLTPSCVIVYGMCAHVPSYRMLHSTKRQPNHSNDSSDSAFTRKRSSTAPNSRRKLQKSKSKFSLKNHGGLQKKSSLSASDSSPSKVL